MSTGNLFFGRRLAEQVVGFRDHDCAYGWDFALRCLLVTEPLFVPETLGFYRLHGHEEFQHWRRRTAREAESVLKNYLFLCRNRRVLNPFAPSPAWGPFFQSFVQASAGRQVPVQALARLRLAGEQSTGAWPPQRDHTCSCLSRRSCRLR